MVKLGIAGSLLERRSRGITRVAEEGTQRGPGRELVWHHGRDVGIAKASKDTQMSVVRVSTVQEVERGMPMTSAACMAVKEKCGSVEGLRPVGVWHGRVNEQRANDVVQCAEDPLSAPILRRRVRAGHM